MAIGGIPGALIAGLEGYSQARQREANDARLRADLTMRQRAFDAELQQQQRQLEQMNIAGLAAFGGMPGGLAPSQAPPSGFGGPNDIVSYPRQPMGGGGPPDQLMPPSPAMPRAGGAGFGGGDQGSRSRGYDVPALTRLARESGFDERSAPTMAAISMAESSGNPGAINPRDPGGSYGLTQINAKAHGDQYARAALDPKVAMTEARDISKGGTDFSPWSTYKSGAYKQFLGQAAAAPEARQTASQVAQTIDPMAQGRASLQAMVQQIEKVAPNADPATKFGALLQLQHFMAPYEKLQLEQAIRQHQEEREDRAVKERERYQTSERVAREKFELRKREGKDVGNIQITDEDGKVLYHGVAKRLEDGTYVQPDGSPLPKGNIMAMGKPGKDQVSGGGRAGAQVQRQIIAGKEVLTDLKNIIDLPSSTSTGIFGGRTQGPGLMDALREDIAKNLTSTDAQLTNSAMADIGRELSLIVSPVYGGHWAADQFKALSLAEGQPVTVKLYNIARMRQVAENALEAIVNTSWVDKGNREDAKKMLEDLKNTVPWTTADVIAFQREQEGGDEQSFGDFVKSRGVGGKGQPSKGKEAPSAPSGGTIKLDADGNVIQ